MSTTCSLKQRVTPLQNIVRRKRRLIRCSSYMVSRRPAIIKDVLIRGTINTTAAFAIYISEQRDLQRINMSVIEGFFTESFEVQVAAMLLHLVYDVYHEYKVYTLHNNDDEYILPYDNIDGVGDGGGDPDIYIP